jgi:hypothetical protein
LEGVETAVAGNRKTVVVIEDDEDFLGLVKLMLADTGLQVMPALGGRAWTPSGSISPIW